MENTTNELADWLRDAHAMESNLASMLEGQVERLSSHPILQEGVSRHARESKEHAELVEQALSLLGEDTSALKDGVAKVTGMLSPLGVGMASDAPVKIVLANYAAEHFEIACYRSLIAAAATLGFSEIEAICQRILSDEERMAEELEPMIEEITHAHLQEV